MYYAFLKKLYINRVFAENHFHIKPLPRLKDHHFFSSIIYIYDTNRLSLWSVFWYLMYSFMDLIYTRKVNLDQVWIVIFIKHFFQICILYTFLWCNIKYSTNAPDVEICLFMRRYFSLLLCFYYIYLWKEVPLVFHPHVSTWL